MFDRALLDSSPLHTPVLKTCHRTASLLAGIAAFLAAFSWIHGTSASFELREVLARAILIGAAAGSFSLMACYIYADARQLRLSVGKWLLAVLLSNVFGFLAYLLYSARKTGNWRRATVPVAYIFECLLLGALVLLPLIHTEALPKAASIEALRLPPPPTGPPPRPAGASRPSRRPGPKGDILRTPATIPAHIARLNDLNEHKPVNGPEWVIGSVPGLPGHPGGVSYGLGLGNPLPPRPLPAKPHQERIRRSSQLESARLLYGPKPDYPPLARMARVQGIVRMEAVIGRDGAVQNLRLVSGHPLLIEAAKKAVARWRYQPTLLNGEPVEVVTEIDVNFTLAE